MIDKIAVAHLPEVEDLDLVRRAQQADEADHALTIKQALKKYPRAVFWAMFLSTTLIMEGFDLMMLGSLYGQSVFKNRFGDVVSATGERQISAKWQSGLSNASVCGQIIGLAINSYTQDAFGNRHTMMFFLAWMAAAIFIPVFAPSLAVLAVGQVLCGIAWGTFQTLSTAYASEVSNWAT